MMATEGMMNRQSLGSKRCSSLPPRKGPYSKRFWTGRRIVHSGSVTPYAASSQTAVYRTPITLNSTKDSERKVFLILDNLKVHHARKVKAWLAEHEEAIEVFYLLSYSPELNPDECLNADLKQAVTKRAPARSKKQLKDAAIGHLRKLQKSPARVRSYFKHKPIRYAA